MRSTEFSFPKIDQNGKQWLLYHLFLLQCISECNSFASIFLFTLYYALCSQESVVRVQYMYLKFAYGLYSNVITFCKTSQARKESQGHHTKLILLYIPTIYPCLLKHNIDLLLTFRAANCKSVQRVYYTL